VSCYFVCTAAAARRIPRSKIQIIHEIGEGAFGCVYLGTCDLLAISDDIETSSLASENTCAVVQVAIKALTDCSRGCGMGGTVGGTEAGLDEGASLTAEREFEREAELLTGLRHDNIIRFYGVCDDGNTRMLILEFMPNGDLSNYLRYLIIYLIIV